jgi:rhamnosyltransferase
MISVIIPTKNGGKTLAFCLRSVIDQEDCEKEIIIIDSSSIDNTVKIGLEYNAKIISIDQNEFNHGATRNLGLKHATGDLVFFTVQDAILIDKLMFRNMQNHFTNREIQAVCGHQAVILKDGTNPVLWFKPVSTPVPLLKECKTTEDEMTWDKLKQYIAWDNVNAMYKRDALIDLPFQTVSYGEDSLWCRDALFNKGWKVIYDPSLIVHHYHHLTFQYTFFNTYRDQYFNHLNYKLLKPTSAFSANLLKRVFRILMNHELTCASKFFWIQNNFVSHFAENSALYFFRLQLLFPQRYMKEFYLRHCCVNLMGKQKP